MIGSTSRWSTIADLLAVIVFIAGGAPVALLLLGHAHAAMAAPAVSGLFACIAACLHVLIDVPIAVSWAAIAVSSGVVIAALPRLRRRAVTNMVTRVSRVQYAHLLGAMVLVLLVAVLVHAPTVWDARSIWMFHASWLTGPAADYITAQQLPALQFSHPNYPLLGSASVAVAWQLSGQSEDLLLGSRVIAMMAVTLVCFAASATVLQLGRRAHPAISAAAIILFSTSVVPLAEGRIDEGYMDTLQAVFIVGLAAVLLPTIREGMDWRSAALAAALAVGAANVKQEGLFFVLAVLISHAVVTIRSQSVAKYLPVTAALATYVLWKLFLAAVGSTDTSDASGIAGRVSELFAPTSPAWTILRRLAVGEWGSLILPTFLVMVLMLAAFALARRDDRVRYRTAFFFLASSIGLNAIIVITYALGNTRDEIDFWLITSFGRVTASVVLLAYFAIMVAVLEIAPWRSTGAREDQPE